MNTVALLRDFVSFYFTRKETEAQRRFKEVQFSAIKMTADGAIKQA